MEYYARKIAKKGFVYVMEHAGFQAKLMRAERLEDRGFAHSLPPGQPIPVFPIAALPKAPDDWVRSPGTYVCPVAPDYGLWFDWTMNDALNTAVIASVKGMNPITGQKMEALRLEEYSDKCPVHDVPFAAGNLCEKCGFEWPPQNHICAPNTLWWDGFRQADGKVRQFFFSEDEKRDIASLVIGKENTVPAFGFAFYRPKNPRTAPKTVYRAAVNHWGWGGGVTFGSASKKYAAPGVMGSYGDNVNITTTSFQSNADGGGTRSCSLSAVPDSVQDESASEVYLDASVPPDALYEPVRAKGVVRAMSARVVEKKSVSVGAGAEIEQDLARDSLGVKGWQEEPAALIRLYFCFEPQFREIVEGSGGVKELESRAEGYLKNLPVG